MAIDRTRYRQIQFIGARILQARELNDLQDITQGFAFDDVTSSSYLLSSVFRQGATYNINVGISNKTVSLTAIDNTRPMLIFVRDRWEAVKVAEIASPLTLSPSGPLQTNIYLNWELHIRTSSDDTDLIDSVTSDPTGNMGELILTVSLTDTSAIALSGSQLAKNTSPIIVSNFTHTPTSLSQNFLDNVLPQAFATNQVSGLVKTTTNNPIVVSTDDARMSNTRSAGDGSVHDATVRTPSAAGGTNADGSPTYNLSPDIGGINAAKLIWLGGTQLVSDALAYIKNLALSVSAAFNAHQGSSLGLPTSHPLPTAAQVGAAPLSHVGLPLGLATSHPPVANVNSGGFQLNRSTGGGGRGDPAFGVFQAGSIIAMLSHSGEVFSQVSSSISANPLVESGDVGLFNGSLGFMSDIAKMLAQHVNKTSHKNPHGLAAADIGASTTGYVDSAVANILASAKNYTNAVLPALSLTANNVSGTNVFGTYLVARFGPNNGNAIELAFGVGEGTSPTPGATFQIPVPNSNYGYGVPNVGIIGDVSLRSLPIFVGTVNSVAISQASPAIYGVTATRFDGSGNQHPSSGGVLTWWALWWRQAA